MSRDTCPRCRESGHLRAPPSFCRGSPPTIPVCAWRARCSRNLAKISASARRFAATSVLSGRWRASRSPQPGYHGCRDLLEYRVLGGSRPPVLRPVQDEFIDADLAEAPDHVLEVIHRPPGSQRWEADQGMPDRGGIPAGRDAQVIEA